MSSVMIDQVPQNDFMLRTSMAHKPPIESAVTFPGGRVLEDTYAPSERQEKHAHAHTNVSIVLAGSLEESACGKVEHAFPLSVVVKPIDTEHRDLFGARGARMLSVILTPEFTASLKDWAPGLWMVRFESFGMFFFVAVRMGQFEPKCTSRKWGMPFINNDSIRSCFLLIASYGLKIS